MAILSLICALVVVAIVFYIYFTWTFDYWKRYNVPFEPPTVFVGNMTFLLRDNMSVYLRKLYNKFEGHDYFGIWMFQAPVLVIRTPDKAKEVLITKFNCFSDRAAESDESDPLGAKCLFIVKGEQWVRLRHGLSPAFTRAKIRNMFKIRMPAIANELQELIDKDHCDGPTDIKILFLKYIVEVIAGNIFGVRAESMQDKNAPFLKLGMSFVDWTILRGLEISSIFLFPNLVKLFKFKMFTKENNNFMRALFVKILASRNTDNPDPKAQSRDMMDALLQLKNSSSGYDFTEDDIVAQAGVFFFAGFESTSTTLSLLSYELAFNPEIQESLYQEIKMARAVPSEVDVEGLESFKLLDMCIKETLRKYPVLPYADRLCTENCELSDGFAVKKGTRVLVCIIGLHFDEKYFPDPDRWNPYRFENEKDIVPCTFMPFGEGKRMCIGAKFAMLNMKWTMTTLIERYRFEPCAGTVPPKDMQLSPYTVVSTPNGPIMLNIIRR